MKNFIFKSQQDFHKIVFNKLETIQSEQRNQRMDLARIQRTCDYIIKIMNHQDTMDYFSKKYGEDLTSHQTDLEEHGPPESRD